MNAEQILRRRAELLARPPRIEAPERERLLVEFSSGGARYAVEARWVREVSSGEGLLPLPGVPAFILGILHVRGQIQTVLSLHALLDLPAGQVAAAAYVVLLDMHGVQVCLAADVVHGTRSVSESAIQRLFDGTATARSFILGITEDGLTIISVSELLASTQILVDVEEA